MRSNPEWLAALGSSGMAQAVALGELRAWLLRALLAHFGRNAAFRSVAGREELRQLAEDAVQEALMLIQSRLGSFRGESRFTTWAMAIALRAAFGELRRRRWSRSAPAGIPPQDLPDESPVEGALSPPTPEVLYQRERAWALLREIIHNELSERQRTALVAHAFQEVPMDTVAEWLGTSRDNVYKLIHDARRKLRRQLTARGLSAADLKALFSGNG